ncbi:MAG: hypothetical protein ABIC91_04755 [Nanoarchaeota archaeon]|nr:hypothetical protein [Nanoarchaeota archaeon]MBU1030685.1 hypothetical protein [Nanoarchaeota archaeon]MBU1849344.1 hypothetical protein [Nanoarchaeota archaeon]
MIDKITDFELELKFTDEFEQILTEIIKTINELIRSEHLAAFYKADVKDKEKTFHELKKQIEDIIMLLGMNHLLPAINLLEREIEGEKEIVLIKEEKHKIEDVENKLIDIRNNFQQVEKRLNKLENDIPVEITKKNVSNYIKMLVTNLIEIQNILDKTQPELKIVKSEERAILKEYVNIKNLIL